MRELVARTTRGEIRYFDSFDTIERPAVPLVFLHGWMGSPATASHLRADPRMKGVRIIAPDLPGHGGSFDLPQGYAFADLVQTMIEFVRGLGFDRIALGGHSVGGSTAWEIACAVPELVDRLLLIHPFSNQRKRSAASIVARALLEEGAMTGLGGYDFFGGTGNELIREREKELKLPAVRRLWHVANTIALSHGERLGCPTLLVFGQEDRLSTAEDFCTEVAPGGSTAKRVFPGGHFWFWKDARALVDVVDAFLRTTSRRPTMVPPRSMRASWVGRFDEHPTSKLRRRRLSTT